LVQGVQIAMAPPSPIVVREVWQDNLEQEFSEIARALVRHRFAAFDCEFPGHVFPSTSRHHSQLSPAENYLQMKRNVDAKKYKLLLVYFFIPFESQKFKTFIIKYIFYDLQKLILFASNFFFFLSPSLKVLVPPLNIDVYG
jgi:hypothetical protein